MSQEHEQATTRPTLVGASGSAFPIGSRWRTYHGEEITVTMYYESAPGCWRLCFDGPNGISGHMGQNHINRLTPLDAPNASPSATEAGRWS